MSRILSISSHCAPLQLMCTYLDKPADLSPNVATGQPTFTDDAVLRKRGISSFQVHTFLTRDTGICAGWRWLREDAEEGKRKANWTKCGGWDLAVSIHFFFSLLSFELSIFQAVVFYGILQRDRKLGVCNNRKRLKVDILQYPPPPPSFLLLRKVFSFDVLDIDGIRENCVFLCVIFFFFAFFFILVKNEYSIKNYFNDNFSHRFISY